MFERPLNENTGLTREYTITASNDGDITATVFDFDNDGNKDIYIGSTDYPETRGFCIIKMLPEHLMRSLLLMGLLIIAHMESLLLILTVMVISILSSDTPLVVVRMIVPIISCQIL